MPAVDVAPPSNDAAPDGSCARGRCCLSPRARLICCTRWGLLSCTLHARRAPPAAPCPHGLAFRRLCRASAASRPSGTRPAAPRASTTPCGCSSTPCGLADLHAACLSARHTHARTHKFHCLSAYAVHTLSYVLLSPTTHATSCPAAPAAAPLLHASVRCSRRTRTPAPRTDNGLGNKRNSPDCLLMFHRMRPDWRNNNYRRIT